MDQILLEKKGKVASIRLNRPDKLNALNLDMLNELYRVLCELELDQSIQVLVVTAEGERSFCVGADINDWADLNPMQMSQKWIRTGHRIYDRLANMPQPSIAAVNGFAFGGGLELALACDIRLCSENAQFALPEVSIGTIPGWGGTSRLPKLVGEGRARQMVFTGDRIDAATAEKWGLVNQVFPQADLISQTESMADRILDKAPLAVQIAKEAMSGNTSSIEALGGALASTTQDLKEGVMSFKEKRPASYKGE